MKRYVLLVLIFIAALTHRAQSPDTLFVLYYEDYPYAFTENGKLRGIEVEILEEYASWLKYKKGVSAVTKYKAFSDFSQFYQSVQGGSGKVVGLGSVSNTGEREKQVAFAPPYMQNVSVLITTGGVPTIKTNAGRDLKSFFRDVRGDSKRIQSPELPE